MDTGDRIRLSGEGEAGRNGGPAGDLYVEVHVREHAIFERDGEHLSCEVPVSFATAALGGSVEVPTLEGDVTLKIPAETQSGRVFRLRDKGVKPVRGGARGDLFCRVVVETPVNLSAEQRELIRKLEESLQAHAGQARAAREGLPRGREALLLRRRRRLQARSMSSPAAAAAVAPSSSAPPGAWGARSCASRGGVSRSSAFVGGDRAARQRARSGATPGELAAGRAESPADHERSGRRARRARDVVIDFSSAARDAREPRRLPRRAQGAADRHHRLAAGARARSSPPPRARSRCSSRPTPVSG